MYTWIDFTSVSFSWAPPLLGPGAVAPPPLPRAGPDNTTVFEIYIKVGSLPPPMNISKKNTIMEMACLEIAFFYIRQERRIANNSAHWLV